jgi:hypothetical protein
MLSSAQHGADMSETKPAPQKPDPWHGGLNIWAVSYISWVLCVLAYELTLTAAEQPEAWLRRLVMAGLAILVPFLVLSAYRKIESEDEAEKAEQAKLEALQAELEELRAELALLEKNDSSSND